MPDDPEADAEQAAGALVLKLMTVLASSLGSKAGGQIAGWALKTFLGDQDVGDELGDLKKQLDDLDQKVANLSNEIGSAKSQILSAVESAEYDGRVTTLDGHVSVINSLIDSYTEVLNRGPGPSRDKDLDGILTDIKSQVWQAATAIDDTLRGTNAAEKPLLKLWNEMILNKKIMIEPCATQLSAPLTFYTLIQARAALLLVEAYHAEDPPDTVTAKFYFDKITDNLNNQAKMVPKSAGPGILTDSRNGLMWQQPVPEMRWHPAHDKVRALDTGGYKDWRMPELAEVSLLLTGWRETWLHLVNGVSCEHKWLTALGFTGVDEGEWGPNGYAIWRDINEGPFGDGNDGCGILFIRDDIGFSNGGFTKDNMGGVHFWAVRGAVPTAGKVQNSAPQAAEK